VEPTLRIMVVGASRSRDKFGNKALRAYQKHGHTVLPVNPGAAEVEGLRSYASVRDVPGPIDRVLLYLGPRPAMEVLDDLQARGDIGELWLAPGADDPAVVAKAEQLGLNTVLACSILAVGEAPGRL
jgi:uncharacterized protein